MISSLPFASFFHARKSNLVLKHAGTSAGVFTLFVFLGALSTSAHAVTITFKEGPQEGPVTASLDLSGCSGCIKGTETGGAETGVISFTAPAGFFDLPTGVSLARANLVDPPLTPGGTSVLSDHVFLDVSNTAQLISITASFFSDSDNVITHPQFGSIPETGALQDMSGSFAQITSTGDFPAFLLPANLIVKVQSDVIPEPSMALLLGAGVLVLVAIGWRRDLFKGSREFGVEESPL